MSTGAGALFSGTGAQSQMIPSDVFNTNAFGGGMGSSGGAPMGGQNQYMNYPALPNFTPGSTNPSYPIFQQPGLGGKPSTPGGGGYIGHSTYENPTYSPQFTGQFFSLLQSLMGQGGGLQNDFLNFLRGGQTNIPGMTQLGEMAQTGDPISALPEWQSMLTAQKQNIEQNQANLKEQFGFAGDLQSSPFGTAMSNYEQQTTRDQNALLGQLQTQALEAAQGRKLAAGQDIAGMAGNETQFLDQLFASSALASPGLTKKGQSSILGGIGSLIGAGASGASAGLAASAGGASDIGAILAGLAAI